jgi:hypothetical protein
MLLSSAALATSGVVIHLSHDAVSIQDESTSCDSNGQETSEDQGSSQEQGADEQSSSDEQASDDPGSDEQASDDQESEDQDQAKDECDSADDQESDNQGASEGSTHEHTDADCLGAAGMSEESGGGSGSAGDETKKTGLDNAIARVLANCIKNPQAPGLLNALRHLVANQARHEAHDAEKEARRAAHDAAKAEREASKGAHGKDSGD